MFQVVPGSQVILPTLGEDMNGVNLHSLTDEELLRHAYNQSGVLTPLELELSQRLSMALDRENVKDK